MKREELIKKLEDIEGEDFEVNEAVLQDKYFSNAQEKADRTDYQETTQKPPRNCPETTQKILLEISGNARITAGGLAKKFGISKAGVCCNLNRLKKDKLPKSVGPDRGSLWNVMK